MKKRLYLKFITAYICFALLSFAAVTLITSHLLQKHMIKSKTEAMYQEANKIAAGRLMRSYRDDTSLLDIYTNLSYLSSYQNMDIWLMNTQGEILLNTAKEYTTETVESLTDFDPTALSGSYYIQGSFFGHFPNEVLSVVAPITSDSNYRAKGYIAIHYDMAKLNTEKNDYLNINYITFVIILLLSLLLLLAFTLVVYRPITKLITGANEFAAGNLNYKLTVDHDDELGYLAAFMNYMSGEVSESSESQRKFVSNVSHDLRSPLTSIKGYAEAMLDGTIPPEMQEKYLNIVVSETERLNKLSSSLLTLNKFDDKGSMLELCEFDINEVIRDTATSFEGTFHDKQVGIELTFSEEVQPVYADLGKIQQVLYNLIDNAIKFSDFGTSIYIDVTEKYEKVFISVKDMGEGIPKASISKVWERFYKTDPSRGKDKKGTGLGLAITKEIIQAHKENINVVSTEGVGSEFTFSLAKPRED